jgi:hypothetical protein
MVAPVSAISYGHKGDLQCIHQHNLMAAMMELIPVMADHLDFKDMVSLAMTCSRLHEPCERILFESILVDMRCESSVLRLISILCDQTIPGRRMTRLDRLVEHLHFVSSDATELPLQMVFIMLEDIFPNMLNLKHIILIPARWSPQLDLLPFCEFVAAKLPKSFEYLTFLVSEIPSLSHHH